MKQHYLLIVLIISIFIIMDKVIENVMTPYIRSSGQVFLNCYEIVRRDNPEKVWDKVFFGSSVVISSYREEESTSGYINAGLNCGLVSDLWAMIKKNEIKIGSELVIAFNSVLSLYDDFMPDPTNPWKRKWYEPYCYFQRDRLRMLVKNAVLTYIFKDNKLNRPYLNQRRELYFGAMSNQELRDKLSSERFKVYSNLKFTNLKENMKALRCLTDYCKRNKIRLRFVWIDPNPQVEMFPISKEVYTFIKNYAKENEIEILDLSGKFDEECYYDQAHLNYEYGSHVFTEVIDPWLKMKE